jgi:hypothetical protein
MFSRREQRVALLSRTSQALSHVAAEDAEQARALAHATALTSLESHAPIEAEREAMSQLQSDVRRFADVLRAQGLPPEVAVRRLKATVDPVVYSAREHDVADVEWRRAVAGDVMRWFVEAYYTA